MEFPTIDKLVKDVAEKALNEITYEGKTLREWVEIIVKQDCISREQALKEFAEKCGGECACCEYNGSGYDNAENCKLIKSLPPVTPKASCEACREQVLKHLEKEDWADTVNCVMNMPFINKPCVSEGACREDKIQVLDKIRAEIEQVSFTHYFEYGEYYGEDTRQERIVNFDTVMQIIDKYRSESEGEDETDN